MKTPPAHVHRPQALGELTGRLRRQSRKVTAPRAAILEVLRRHPHPLTNREIFAGLPRGQCDLATIYRAVRLLEKLGMVQRFDFGDGVARYELVEAEEAGHHHHLICTRCAGVVELAECFPAEMEERIARQNGFAAVTHRLEFFGVCPDCQK